MSEICAASSKRPRFWSVDARASASSATTITVIPMTPSSHSLPLSHILRHTDLLWFRKFESCSSRHHASPIASLTIGTQGSIQVRASSVHQAGLLKVATFAQVIAVCLMLLSMSGSDD